MEIGDGAEMNEQGAVPVESVDAQGARNEEEGGAAGVELRDTLQSLDIELSQAVRARVLQLVHGDVARAIDWIMENQETLARWSSEEDMPPRDDQDQPAEQQILHGESVITLDQRRGVVVDVHGTIPPRLLFPESDISPPAASYCTPPSSHSPKLSGHELESRP
jgi:hypothetical protein